jgi:hypothetical protein
MVIEVTAQVEVLAGIGQSRRRPMCVRDHPTG